MDKLLRVAEPHVGTVRSAPLSEAGRQSFCGSCLDKHLLHEPRTELWQTERSYLTAYLLGRRAERLC